MPRSRELPPDWEDPAATVEAYLSDAASGLNAARTYLRNTAQTVLDNSAGTLDTAQQRLEQTATATLSQGESLLAAARAALEQSIQGTLADALTQAQDVGVDLDKPPPDTEDLECGDTYTEPGPSTDAKAKAPPVADNKTTVNVYCDKPKPKAKPAEKPAEEPTTTGEDIKPKPKPKPKPEEVPAPPTCQRVAFDPLCSPELLTLIGQREAYLIDRDPAKVAQAYAALVPAAARVLDPNLSMDSLQSMIDEIIGVEANDYVDPIAAPAPGPRLQTFGRVG